MSLSHFKTHMQIVSNKKMKLLKENTKMKIKLLVESKIKNHCQIKQNAQLYFKCFVNIHIQAKVEVLNL